LDEKEILKSKISILEDGRNVLIMPVKLKFQFQEA